MSGRTHAAFLGLRAWDRRLGIASVVLGSVLTLCACSRHSELIWKNTAFTAVGAEGRRTVTGIFRFENQSERPVRIVSVTPSCDCTTARADKAVYPPASEGTILAEFSIGERTGFHEVTIAVVSDEIPKKTTALALHVDIPEVVSVEPRAVYWLLGGATEEKTVSVTTSRASGVSIGGVRSSDPRFTATAERAGSAGEWRILIRPTRTQNPMQGVIVLQAAVDGRVYSEAIHVLVK